MRRALVAVSLSACAYVIDAGGEARLLRAQKQLRARPVNVSALGVTKAVVTTRCEHNSDPGCAPTEAIEGLGGPARLARDPQAASSALPERAIHSSLTSCKGHDCATITASRPPPDASGLSLAERVSKLEDRMEEEQRQDDANATWMNITGLALDALKEYDAGVLRGAAAAIRERTTPEQMALRNISQKLYAVSKIMEKDNKAATLEVDNRDSDQCCQEQTAACLACAQSVTVQEFCGDLNHVKVDGCDMPIDLSKLVIPNVTPDDPLSLEDRVNVLEAAMARKLHKRLDKIEASRAGPNATRLSGKELRDKAKRLKGEIRQELAKKVAIMENHRHESLLKKVASLEEEIEDGGKSEPKDSVNHQDADRPTSSDVGIVGADASGVSDEGSTSEVLDANNDEAIFHLGSDEDAVVQSNEYSTRTDCGVGHGRDGGPCSAAGSHGLDRDGKALYVGGPPDVAPMQPVFHKVKTLDQGALSADLVTDLDDPPPKTNAAESSNSVPLDQIVEGSDAPKSKIVSTARAQNNVEA
eukprot:g2682.t1